MRKLAIKIDNFRFKFTKKVILTLIRRYKYKYHKYDILCKIMSIDIALFFLCIILLPVFGMYLRSANKAAIIFHIFIWGMLFSFRVFGLIMTTRLARHYDVIWQNKNEPTMYSMEKSICKVLFLSSRKMRHSLIKVECFVIPLLLLLSITFIGFEKTLPIYIMIDAMLFNVIDRYTPYVFDLRKPKQKKRVTAFDELTEIAKKSWHRIVDGIKNPALQPSIQKT